MGDLDVKIFSETIECTSGNNEVLKCFCMNDLTSLF